MSGYFRSYIGRWYLNMKICPRYLPPKSSFSEGGLSIAISWLKVFECLYFYSASSFSRLYWEVVPEYENMSTLPSS